MSAGERGQPGEDPARGALARVQALARSWATLTATEEDPSFDAEISARVGRHLLDVIHGGAGDAACRVGLVTKAAESWLTPGGPGLFYPAAGQAVLDAIRGASTESEAGWRERAEAAEARLTALAGRAPEIVPVRAETEILFQRVCGQVRDGLSAVRPELTVGEAIGTVAGLAAAEVLRALRVMSGRQLAVLLAQEADRHAGHLIREPPRYSPAEITDTGGRQ